MLLAGSPSPELAYWLTKLLSCPTLYMSEVATLRECELSATLLQSMLRYVSKCEVENNFVGHCLRDFLLSS